MNAIDRAISEQKNAVAQLFHHATSYRGNDAHTTHSKRAIFRRQAVVALELLIDLISEKIGVAVPFPASLPDGKLLQTVIGNNAVYVTADKFHIDNVTIQQETTHSRVTRELTKGLQ